MAVADLEEWTSDANEVVTIRLKHSSDSQKAHDQFHPAFTYPIFGEDEKIFGYKGLKIRVELAGNTLKPSLRINYDEKYAPVGETKADEVEEILKECLPDPRDEDPKESETPFEPPGELLHQYQAGGKTYGIWATDLTDERAKELLRNMQILVLFFIEGGSLLELDDPDWTMKRWTIFLVYAIEPIPSKPQASIYNLVGYSTAYRLFFLDTTSPIYRSPPGETEHTLSATSDPTIISRLPCRQRISQFLILPPYKSSGHGSTLYSTMVRHFLALLSVHEITVEDPNESFDDLRDVNDLIRLRATDHTFASLAVNAAAKLPSSRSAPFDPDLIIPAETLASLRTSTKIAPRQFGRLVEMQTLSKIPTRHRSVARLTRKDKSSDANDRAYYFWRLYVKLRLYKHNVDQLAQLELEERLEKLEATLNAVETDYVRLLEMVEEREKNYGAGTVSASGAKSGTLALSRGKKRRIIDDDDDEHDEGDDEATNGDSAVDMSMKDDTNGKADGDSIVMPPKKKRLVADVVDLVDLASEEL